MTTTIRRMTLSVAGLALAAASLTACGGDSDSDGASTGSDTSASASASESASSDPSADSSDEADTEGEADASDSEFCSIYGDLFEQVTGSLGGGDDITTVIPQLKDFADQLEEAGAPDGIPEDAERGFEISIKAIQDLPDDATQEDLLSSSQSYSAEDQADATAFGQYVISACPDLVPAGSVPTSPTSP